MSHNRVVGGLKGVAVCHTIKEGLMGEAVILCHDAGDRVSGYGGAGGPCATLQLGGGTVCHATWGREGSVS